MKLILILFACILKGINTNHFNNRQVIQINTESIFNARPVSTFGNGKIISWTKGIDGNGAGDGYLTQAAAAFNGDKDPHALPDNPVINANAVHPDIMLYYNNNEPARNQARFISGAGEFKFAVPEYHYSDLYLALTSSEGAAPLQFELLYADGVEFKNYLLPDYYQDLPANDPNLCFLVHNLAKWGNRNNMTEKDHHNIDLLNIHPNASRILKGVKITKAPAGYLLFWGATGVTAD